jgi:hypothetical protein
MASRRQTKGTKHLLSVAAFCLKVLEDRNGLLSGINFTDHYYVLVPPNRDPEQRHEVTVWAFIGFKARTFTPGELTGNHSLRLVLRSPKGKKARVGEHTATASKEAISLNFRIKLNLRVKTEGLWWADVLLDGKHYAKMPLRVIFQRADELVSASGS